MARKRYSDEDALKVLREIDVYLYDGLDVVSSCRKARISDKTYYHWRKKFGGLVRSQLSEMRALRKENERLKEILTKLQLDKLILCLSPLELCRYILAKGVRNHGSKALF